MLIRKKYFFYFFPAMVLLAPVLALLDLERQQDLAEKFAGEQMARILSKESSLTESGLPKSLLGSNLNRVDTNYTFTQWEVVFAFEKGGFAQVYVKPKHFFIVPILNFKEDFAIDYIGFETNG